MSLFDSSYHAFGLDIGDRSIKAVELRYNRFVIGKSRLELSAWNEVQVPEGVFGPGRVEQPDAATELLRDVVASAEPRKIKTRAVVVSLPETTTFVKTIEIPKVDPEHIPEEIEKEAEEHIPLPLNEATLDWQILPGAEDASRLRVVVAAAPRILVENFTTALEAAGFTTLSVEIEALAIVRGLLLDEAVPPNEAIAILDLGASRSSVIIYDYGTIQLSASIPFSGDAVTARLAEQLKITWNEAEKAKIVCGLDPTKCKNRIRPVIGGIITELVRNVHYAFRSYRQKNPGSHPIGLVILTGGTANAFKMDSYLSQKLLVRVLRGDPIHGFTVPAAFPFASAASFTTAIGLARRAVRFSPAEASGNEADL